MASYFPSSLGLSLSPVCGFSDVQMDLQSWVRAGSVLNIKSKPETVIPSLIESVYPGVTAISCAPSCLRSPRLIPPSRLIVFVTAAWRWESSNYDQPRVIPTTTHLSIALQNCFHWNSIHLSAGQQWTWLCPFSPLLSCLTVYIVFWPDVCVSLPLLAWGSEMNDIRTRCLRGSGDGEGNVKFVFRVCFDAICSIHIKSAVMWKM